MAAGTLYTYAGSFRAFKVLIAAQFSGADIQIAPDFKLGETNKTDSFREKFPLCKVPAFEASNGACLFETNAIAFYVGNAALRGATDEDAALVLQWISFGDNEITPAACTWVFPCLGIIQYNKQACEDAKERIKQALGILNTHLKTRTFLVGERISQADISVACDLLILYENVLDPAFREPFGNVTRWFTTVINQPEVLSVIGERHLCAKMKQFDAKKFQELHKKDQKQEKSKQEKKKEEKKEKPEKKEKKQEKKAKEVEPEEEMDETEKVMAEEPKSKDPFMAFPKGTFVMDDWKKCYSNEETVEIAIPYFWEKFDKENYSIWYSEYLYPEDLSLVFMSCNLIGGMFQRLDKMRKNAFASVCVFGENNNSTISGIWIWRGHELAFTLSPDWQIDYESYKWTKLDPDDEKTKKMVNEYWAWEGDFDGKKFNQGKIYK